MGLTSCESQTALTQAWPPSPASVSAGTVSKPGPGAALHRHCHLPLGPAGERPWCPGSALHVQLLLWPQAMLCLCLLAARQAAIPAFRSTAVHGAGPSQILTAVSNAAERERRETKPNPSMRSTVGAAEMRILNGTDCGHCLCAGSSPGPWVGLCPPCAPGHAEFSCQAIRYNRHRFGLLPVQTSNNLVNVSHARGM